jgi:hypothetical protein
MDVREALLTDVVPGRRPSRGDAPEVSDRAERDERTGAGGAAPLTRSMIAD